MLDCNEIVLKKLSYSFSKHFYSICKASPDHHMLFIKIYDNQLHFYYTFNYKIIILSIKHDLYFQVKTERVQNDNQNYL